MSNIAIFETTTELGGCGLNINGNILEAFCSPSMQKHSQTLLPLFDNLLQSQNLSPKDLQAVAFGAGPGAFSGLRFSVATAQAFALALNIPAIPVSSALALVFWAIKYLLKNPENQDNLSQNFQIFSTLDARMNEIYIAKFEFENSEFKDFSAKNFLQNLVENFDNSWFAKNIQLIKISDFYDFVSQNDTENNAKKYKKYKKYIVGNAEKLLDATQKSKFAENSQIQFLPEIVPKPQEVGEIAAEYFSQNKNLQNAANALPIYIRNKVAETTAEREKNKTQK